MPALSHRLVEPAKLLVIVGIAYTAASAGWYFFSTPTPQPLDAGRSAARSERPAAVPLDEILAANLFGRADAGAAAAPSTFDAPATQLRLTLEGVFHAGDPQNSAAIVSEQGRPGELIHVGQRFAGDVELIEVHADRVVLRRGGLFETLRFPTDSALLAADNAAMSMPIETYAEPVYEEPIDQAPVEPDPAAIENVEPAPAPMSNDVGTVRDVIDQYRSRLESDPTGTLSELGVTPVTADAAQGYQLGNLANSPYLAQTGLQPGDVVLSVNGRPVGNVQQDRLEIANIVAQGSARLEVQRGERRFFVTASIR